ncbi:MAG: hypothetical protein K2W95_13705 [Candidatus Obscuribacterales bacterium]|nr:hypothetical protein [Candidatus Obscuribacterales bacterium]
MGDSRAVSTAGKKERPSDDELEKVTKSIEKEDAKPLKDLLDGIDSFEKRREVLNVVKAINERHRAVEDKLPALEVVSKVPQPLVGRSNALTTTVELKGSGQIGGKVVYIETLDLQSLKRTSNANPGKADSFWIRNR